MKSTTPAPAPGTLSRRDFLRAAGISIMLPAFESLAAAPAASAGGPMRLVCLSSALGMNPEAFFPKAFGADYELSPELQPLAGMRNDFTVFSHLEHPTINGKHDAMSALLSGIQADQSRRAGDNVSMDQVAARHVAHATRFPSMHVSLGGDLDCSWSYSGVKLRSEPDPRVLFDRLFVNDSEAASRARDLQITEQGSILDLVLDQARGLRRRMAGSDQAKFEEYLSAIREAEVKLQGIKRWNQTPKPGTDYTISGRPHSAMDYGMLSPLMFDLLHLALVSDATRVFTAGYGMHNNVIELDGVTDGYHGLTHHGNLPERLRQLRIIETFYVGQMARFLKKLKSTPAGDGTLLDRTMVFFGSALGDAARHSNRDLPILLAGGGFNHGRHIDCRRQGERLPLNNLYTTLLQRFGVPLERFSSATGTVTL